MEFSDASHDTHVEKKPTDVSYKWARFSKLWNLAYNEIQRRSVSYCLGFLAVLFVVFLVALALSLIDNVPIVFAKLAENDHGEIDVQLYPSIGNGFRRLNHTRFSLKASAVPENGDRYSYHSPRITNFNIPVYSLSNCPNLLEEDLYNTTFRYYGSSGDPDSDCARAFPHNSRLECLPQECDPQQYTVTLIAIDTERERRMQLGRSWKADPIPYGSCYMTTEYAELLNITVDDVVVVRFNGWSDLTGVLIDDLPSTMSDDERRATWNKFRNEQYVVYLPLRVAQLMDGVQGKVDHSDDESLFVEYEHLLAMVAENIFPAAEDVVVETFNSSSLYDFSETIVWNIPPNRLDAYKKSNYDAIQADITRFASSGIYLIGFNQVFIYMDNLEYISDVRFAVLFLSLILTLILSVVVLLSIMLIYSLLMVNVETRTFELGLLRIVGLNKASIVTMLLDEAAMYAIPGWAGGLVLASGLNYVMMTILGNVIDADLERILPMRAWVFSTLVAFGIPAVSAIVPVRRALRVSLVESLEHERAKTPMIKYSIKRASDTRIAWGFLLVGSLLAVFGAAVYYMLPLSIVSFDFELLLNILFWILLGMLFGLLLFVLNFEHVVERVLAKCLLFWTNIALRKIVLQNLVAHRPRNRKTTVMYALSLAFIILLAVSFDVELRSAAFETKRTGGSRLYLESEGGCFHGMRSLAVKTAIEDFADGFAEIEQYAWVSQSLELMLNGVDMHTVNIGHTLSIFEDIYGVSPSAYDVLDSQFWDIGRRVNSLGAFSATEELYSSLGTHGALVSANLKDNIEVDAPLEQFLYEFEADRDPFNEYIYNRTLSMGVVNKSPIFGFSEFPQSFQDPTQLVSFPTLVRLANGAGGGRIVSGVDDVPMWRFQMKLVDGVSDKTVSRMHRQWRQFLGREGICAGAYNTQDDVDSIEDAALILNYVFLFFAAMAIIISSFSLFGNMFTNIHEQAKEIGILRAIGAEKSFLSRVYLCEAWLILNSASVMGIVIGTFVGITITLQRQLFTQLPIGFVFPWMFLILNILLGTLIAFFSAYIPVKGLLRQSIVTTLKHSLD